MNFSFANEFSPKSRVWVYQSNTDFTEEETKEIEALLSAFSKQWTAHDQQLKAIGKILFNRFIVLLVDETHAGASGCSIDKSVHFIKEIENEYGVDLFDRLKLLFKSENEIISIPLSELNEKFSEGVINEQSIFFNNTVQTLSELQSNWMVPVANSWLASRLKKESLKI